MNNKMKQFDNTLSRQRPGEDPLAFVDRMCLETGVGFAPSSASFPDPRQQNANYRSRMHQLLDDVLDDEPLRPV
jgi:hypothetical protein